MPPPSMASCAHSAAVTAKLFTQLTPPPPPRCAPKPVLEFLWPRAGTVTARRTFRNSSSSSSSISARSATRMRAASSSSSAAAARRISSPRRPGSGCFGPTTTTTPRAVFFMPYTSARRFTQAVFNPQKDEDGNEMKLEITPRAAKRLSDIMSKDANPNLALRIQVESGGCHGFQYLMSLVTLPERLPQQAAAAAPPSEHPGEGAEEGAVREDDTIFTYAPDGGETTDAAPPPAAGTEVSGAPKIILDQPSLELLKGSKVDFTMELIGSQFKIVDNPLATSSCGCGTSFDIKF